MNDQWTIGEFTRGAVEWLALAESKYLGRDPSFLFSGVAVHPNGPHIFLNPKLPPPFPQVPRLLWIHVTPDVVARQDFEKASWQISHEVIHLLAPTDEPPAIMLEEGLAVEFSVAKPRKRVGSFMGYSPAYLMEAIRGLSNDQNYWDAWNVYHELMKIEPDAIQKLRAQEPAFHKMTPEFISTTIPKVPADLAARLCERRKMRKGAPSTSCVGRGCVTFYF